MLRFTIAIFFLAFLNSISFAYKIEYLGVLPNYQQNEFKVEWETDGFQATNNFIIQYKINDKGIWHNIEAINPIVNGTLYNYSILKDEINAGAIYNIRIKYPDPYQDLYSKEVTCSYNPAIIWPVYDKADCDNCTGPVYDLLLNFNQPIEWKNSIFLHSGIDVKGSVTVLDECVKSPVSGVVNSKVQREEGTELNIEFYLNNQKYILSLQHLKNVELKVDEIVNVGDFVGNIDNAAFTNDNAHLHIALTTEAGSYLNPLENLWDIDPFNKPPEVKKTSMVDEPIRFSTNTNFGYPLSYLPDNGIIYGAIDIVAECIDKQSQVDPWQIPYMIGYSVDVSNGNGWKSAINSYTLLNSKSFFSANATNTSPITIQSLIDSDPAKSAYIESGYIMNWCQWFTFIVTNTKDNSGTRESLNMDQCWATDAKNTAAKGSNGYSSDYAKAQYNGEALFPDGKYKVKIHLADLLYNSTTSKEVVLDNFFPYIASVEVRKNNSAGDITYKAGWERNGSTLVFNKNIDGSNSNTDDIYIKITASEPLSDLAIRIFGKDFIPKSTDNITWELIIPSTSVTTVKPGNEKITIYADDLACNQLQKIPAQLVKRNSEGEWEGTINPGDDENHTIKMVISENPLTLNNIPIGGNDLAEGDYPFEAEIQNKSAGIFKGSLQMLLHNTVSNTDVVITKADNIEIQAGEKYILQNLNYSLTEGNFDVIVKYSTDNGTTWINIVSPHNPYTITVTRLGGVDFTNALKRRNIEFSS